MPQAWLNLTTHRLDIYDESLAKTQFLDQFESLFQTGTSDVRALGELPTAYDYIRLGHPLSSVLEWAVAKSRGTKPEQIISFSSRTAPILAILRKNLLDGRRTQIVFKGRLPENFDPDALRSIYGYAFELRLVENSSDLEPFDGTTIYVSEQEDIGHFDLIPNVDFQINHNPRLGSVVLVSDRAGEYISEIQHVRRRETIAMTPVNCLKALNQFVGQNPEEKDCDSEGNKKRVLDSIKTITGTDTNALIGSSGLSVQYAIMMGLIEDAQEKHPGKAVRFVVPPNCYGGTNDQARRVAACLDHVEIVDLAVDGGNDMVLSLDAVLNDIAKEDAIPNVIAEIPTNPRVEVPDLEKLRDALSAERKTATGETAISPVFILDQTFCPNVNFLGDDAMLSSVQVISYVSGSKFPSGGKCTAGYCVANVKAADLMNMLAKHLRICDNEATDLQMEILSQQLPSILERIQGAYVNTREFVNFIEEKLPAAKINFVSEELAEQGFTPSVFSLDLPTKGTTDAEREEYKREQNLRLINLMITEIPDESKYCVSYGQLQGCYWTIPATSTQGTTKEADKDYIARVALSADMDLERHKEVFLEFVKGL